MLELAIKHKDQLISKMYDTWFKDKYKFYNNANYYNEIVIADNTCDLHQFVSINSKKEVIGFIEYNINRPNNSANELCIINLTNDINTFGSDCMTAIKDIFEKFNIRKLSFSVLIGNPIESKYDKLIVKYGGRIVGIKKDEIKLLDGKYYDEKMYEIFRNDYKK